MTISATRKAGLGSYNCKENNLEYHRSISDSYRKNSCNNKEFLYFTLTQIDVITAQFQNVITSLAMTEMERNSENNV